MYVPREDRISSVSLSSLKKGDILTWCDFTFKDGSTKTKRVLLLSGCTAEKTFFVVLPTSHIRYYIEAHNDNVMVDTVCFTAGEISCFEKDTVIDLKNIGEVSVDQLRQAKAFLRESLPPSALTKVMTAVRDAKTVSRKRKQAIFGES